MRFRFCGDADCPDWVLAEINSLSRLSSIKLKLLAQVVADSWLDVKGLNIEKVRKLLSDSKLDNTGDLKATIACINFILNSAVRHGCDESALASELQQLGLPQEHSQALRRVYVDRQDTLTKQLRSQSLRINRLQGVQVLESPVPGFIYLELTIQEKQERILIKKTQAINLLKNLKSIELNLNSLQTN
ncbi:COMM domain-containing protein 4 [Chrysoperla carnea]|uniref:COMM domain-containing protein 4 n=1 Tax=Chrysoperla carnea TaxID=189513 RepID=UPI001D09986B|nr:COMM domain-containing protein 4 [Chrysoperla carnea]